MGEAKRRKQRDPYYGKGYSIAKALDWYGQMMSALPPGGESDHGHSWYLLGEEKSVMRMIVGGGSIFLHAERYGPQIKSPRSSILISAVDSLLLFGVVPSKGKAIQVEMEGQFIEFECRLCPEKRYRLPSGAWTIPFQGQLLSENVDLSGLSLSTEMLQPF
jgi:hypothetical protein